MTEYRTELVNLQSNLLGYAINLAKNRCVANDLLQDTYLKVLESEGRYNTSDLSKISTRVMRNIYINEYNFNKRFKDGVIDNRECDSCIDDVEYKFLISIVNGLEETICTPFKMYIDGYSYQDISNELNVPLNTIRTRIFRARKELKHKIKRWT